MMADKEIALLSHFPCSQEKVIRNVNEAIVRMDERWENLTPLFSKMSTAVEQFNVLLEKDIRREKDIGALTGDISIMKEDISTMKIRMEGLTVKMAIILAVGVFLGGIIGGVVADRFKGDNTIVISESKLKSSGFAIPLNNGGK